MEESVSMNPRIHNTAMKMAVDGPKGGAGTSRRPFRARAGRDATQGSAFGSTLGYIPVLTGHMVNRSYRAHGEQIPKGNIEW